MEAVISRKDLPAAAAIFRRYGALMKYNEVIINGEALLIISEGPINAILEVRAVVSKREYLELFKLI